MSNPTISRIAADLLDAHDRATLLEPPSAQGSFSIADAYAVGAQLVALRRARGEQTIGRKIGFTNTTIWEEYGVDRPMWAHVYGGTVQHAAAGVATLALAGTVAPRIEPEVVFGLREPIPAGASDPAALLACIGWLALGFEIVDCHFADWRFSSADCAADFGLHARLVIGTPLAIVPKANQDLIEQLASFNLTLRCDGAVAATGGGANVLGSPLRALAHLVETIELQGAEPLAAGEVITTGTLTPALPVRPGATWQSAVSGIQLPGLELKLVS